MQKAKEVSWVNRSFIVAIILFVICSSTSLSLYLPLILAQSSYTCPTGYNIGINNAAGNVIGGSTIVGPANLTFGTSLTPTSPINRVEFINNYGVIMGRAQPTSTYSWSMPWLTSLVPNGVMSVQAIVYFADNTQCRTGNLAVNLQNPTLTNLTTAVTPASWAGPMSYSFSMSAAAYVPENGFDATKYAIFTWSTTVGTFPNNIGNNVQFSSGSTAGSGTAKVIVQYSGRTVAKEIPISVANTTAPLPSPNTTQSTSTVSSTTTTSNNTSSNTTNVTSTNKTISSTLPSSSTANITSVNTAASQLAEQKAAALQNSPSAQGCAINVLGQERFESINSGSARPTAEELKKISVCFASSNYILPSNFAPISPLSINKLPAAQGIKVHDMANEIVTKNNNKIDVLKISGNAKPNSTVVIYIFSDPLVLTTTTNDNGDWSYSLENPIEPGNHEVYAVADKGDGTYEKSNPLSFVIGTAVAADNNPDGLSLKLASDPTPAQSNRTIIMFISAASILVIMTIVGLIVALRHRRGAFVPMINNTPQALIKPNEPISSYISPIQLIDQKTTPLVESNESLRKL